METTGYLQPSTTVPLPSLSPRVCPTCGKCPTCGQGSYYIPPTQVWLSQGDARSALGQHSCQGNQ